MFKRILRNETGQMAVFIALIFQVLFVLFAMVINIGLIVHDKINLQNSVDLAAYYAASKQAEEMNMIAHINYQMRQDYKLLAWRFRVLGSFGLLQPSPHPAADQSGKLDDTSWGGQPSICLAHQAWKEFADKGEGNACNRTNLQIPDLRPIHYIPLSPPINISVVSQFAAAREAIGKRCDAISPLNWAISSIFVTSFKYSGAARKKQIQKLAANLSIKDEMIDLTGESVRAGALATFRKNLTFSNKQPSSFDDKNDFEIVNGLGMGGCEQPDELGFPAWLQEIQIAPSLLYTDLERKGNTSQCDAKIRFYDDPPAADPTGVLDASTIKTLKDNAGEDTGKTWTHSSRGFEKNPWCLAYVGVKAKTKPRKPFAPFGSPIQMEAKAFAEPFGGRIGPWYGTTWPSGAAQSDESTRTDPLAVPRGDFDKKYAELYFPNYSRYPGDIYGLKSKLALGMLRKNFLTATQSSNLQAKFSFADFGNLLLDVQSNGDVLSHNAAGAFTQTRKPELLSVTPDLFDITYYSVDPNYYDDFFHRAQAKTFMGLPFISDVGSRFGDNALEGFRVLNEVKMLNDEYPDAKDAFYIIPDPSNVLTGWLQGGAVDYSTESANISKNFGKCSAVIDEGKDSNTSKPRIPGNCNDGGRVGYSVRLIHKDYLMASDHELGGKGAGKAKIKNAPDPNF